MKEKSAQIWKVHTERIGFLESFRSEVDMESFLVNNPAILCYRTDENKIMQPELLRQQLGTKVGKGTGRIDLVGLIPSQLGYELLIFELKKDEIDIPAVQQLVSYLNDWNSNKSGKEVVLKWAEGLDLKGITSEELEFVISNPKGVLVGNKFRAEAIAEAVKNNLRGIRMARFRAEEKGEYYVIIEDQIGDVLSTSRFQWSWQDLIKHNLIELQDTFKIEQQANSLRFRPDPKALNWYKKKVILDDDSRRNILDKENEILKRANETGAKWAKKTMELIKKAAPIYITNATGLSYLAFGGPTGSYWVPLYWWIHEKSGRRLEELVSELVSSESK